MRLHKLKGIAILENSAEVPKEIKVPIPNDPATPLLDIYSN
jgi:hypothetical protein